MPSDRDRCVTVHSTTAEDLGSSNATLYVVVSGEYKTKYRLGVAELWVDLFPFVNLAGEEARRSESARSLEGVTSIATERIKGHEDAGSDKSGFQILTRTGLRSNLASMTERWKRECYSLFTHEREELDRLGYDLIIGDRDDFRVWTQGNDVIAATYLNKITGPATARSSASASQA